MPLTVLPHLLVDPHWLCPLLSCSVQSASRTLYVCAYLHTKLCSACSVIIGEIDHSAGFCMGNGRAVTSVCDVWMYHDSVLHVLTFTIIQQCEFVCDVVR